MTQSRDFFLDFIKTQTGFPQTQMPYLHVRTTEAGMEMAAPAPDTSCQIRATGPGGLFPPGKGCLNSLSVIREILGSKLYQDTPIETAQQDGVYRTIRLKNARSEAFFTCTDGSLSMVPKPSRVDPESFRVDIAFTAKALEEYREFSKIAQQIIDDERTITVSVRKREFTIEVRGNQHEINFSTPIESDEVLDARYQIDRFNKMMELMRGGTNPVLRIAPHVMMAQYEQGGASWSIMIAAQKRGF